MTGEPDPVASPPQEPPQDPHVARARLRGKRAVLGVFTAFVFVFVGVSTAEILAAALGVTAAPLAPAGEPLPPAARECAEGVRALADAIDRAAAVPATEADEEAAVARFRSALAPVWDARVASTEAQCALSPRGRDAFAALLRLKLAEEGFVRRAVVEIAPLRRGVWAYLPR